MLKLVMIVAVIALLCSVAAFGDSSSAIEQLGNGFHSANVDVNGTSLHYVRGGQGPTIILLHGFPEDWYEFRKVMPNLAKKFTVIAVDLRGVGESSVTGTGYDAETLAEDIHQLALKLDLHHSYVVGHDIGGMVAYALMRKNPGDLRGAMLLDIAFPGMDPWQKIEGHPAFWHVRFHQTALPEKLVTGRQRDYFRYFLSESIFSDAEVSHYSNAYNGDHLKTAFEFYRAFPQNGRFFAAQKSTLEMPIVLGAGEHDAFAQFVPETAAAMRANGCANLTTTLIAESMHYVFEEQPEALVQLITIHASKQ